MSYRIDYDDQPHLQPASILSRFLLTASWFLLFILSVSLFWPQGIELLKLLLVPGDPDVTLEAAEVFAAELQNGFSRESAADFFTALIHGNSY